MAFTDVQLSALRAPLSRSNVRERKQAGRQLSYIESWKAIEEANRIFGFSEWTSETVECRCVAEREREIGKDQWKKTGHGVSYVARVRVTVHTSGATIVREGVGAGHGIDADLGLAHESAIKEAESDARKRALMTFGNPFGLALYDKEQNNVSDDDTSNAGAAKAPQSAIATPPVKAPAPAPSKPAEPTIDPSNDDRPVPSIKPTTTKTVDAKAPTVTAPARAPRYFDHKASTAAMIAALNSLKAADTPDKLRAWSANNGSSSKDWSRLMRADQEAIRKAFEKQRIGVQTGAIRPADGYIDPETGEIHEDAA